MEKTKEIKVIAYCRVSTENQRDEGTIEIQQEEIKNFAHNNNMEIVRFFNDNGISGSLDNRPALLEMIDFLKANQDIDGVIIYKLDRLARDLLIQETIIRDLQRINKRLYSTKETDLDSTDPTRVLIRQVLGSISQYEKSLIAIRLSAGRKSKARKGKHAGGEIPLGYRVNIQLENGKITNRDIQVDSEKASLVKRIFFLYENENLSMNEIAKRLNNEKIPTKYNKKFYASTIRYILKNSVYKGLYSYTTIQNYRPDLTLFE